MTQDRRDVLSRAASASRANGIARREHFSGEPMVQAQSKSWLVELEGLRGLASLWVFSFHVSILSGTHIPLISHGALGVDLFILLSGFLMVHNYEQRKSTDYWGSANTAVHFWVRRFFRIAPLYYLLLIPTFIFGGALGEMREQIGGIFPWTLTQGIRYSDHSLPNILAHISFTFGALPYFSFRTALPDWSIGLEMQFYLIFPFAMLLVLRWGYEAMAGIVMALSLGSFYLWHQFCSSFPMPSFLPLKMHLFLTGMLIAASFHRKLRRSEFLIVLLPLVSMLIHVQGDLLWVCADVLMSLGLLVLLRRDLPLSSLLSPLRKLLNARISQFIGDISYALYLLHLLIVIPISRTLLGFHWMLTLPPILRFGTILAINTLVIVPACALLHAVVEKRGIKLGKSVLRIKKPAAVPITS
jgi:peptidoglycan/LPS O-acetylase OafA/YrhL